MRKSIILVALAVGLTSALVVHAATELARINNKVITLEEFNKRFGENQKFFRYKIPTKKSVLDDLINRELGIQEAKKLGLDKDPEVVERMNTVLYQSLIDKILSKKFNAIQISDSELESFYAKNPEIRTSHIFVQVRSDATKAQEEAAAERVKKVQAALTEAMNSGKQTFAEVANTYSDGIVATTGGDIDYQTKDKLDPAYYDAATKLKVGQVSGIVRTQFGYHIIKLTGIKQFKDVDPGQVKRMLFDEKRNQIFEGYLDELKKKASISVKGDLISG